MPEYLAKTFLSYAHEDSEFVRRLAKDLRAAGADVWVDHDLKGGDHWTGEIEKALEECPCLVMVVSPASIESKRVIGEVTYAQDKRKTVIPLLHRDCKIPHWIYGEHRIDFRQGYAVALQALRRALAVAGPPLAPTLPKDFVTRATAAVWRQIRGNMKFAVIALSVPAMLAITFAIWKALDIERAITALTETDEPQVQERTCGVLQAIASERFARAAILKRLISEIKDGDRVGFRGAADCVALRTFATNQDVRPLLIAIETRLGADGSLCQSRTNPQRDYDNLGVIHAVEAEYSFPLVTGHAQDFLIGIIQNCPDEFDGARVTAMTHLEDVFKAAYKDWDVKLGTRLQDLCPAVSDTVRKEISKYVLNSPCQ